VDEDLHFAPSKFASRLSIGSGGAARMDQPRPQSRRRALMKLKPAMNGRDVERSGRIVVGTRTNPIAAAVAPGLVNNARYAKKAERNSVFAEEVATNVSHPVDRPEDSV
jgi:hypothetical protein